MRKNLTTQLAGSGLSRTSTALPERDVDGEIVEKINVTGLHPSPAVTPEFVKGIKEYFRRIVKTCGVPVQAAYEDCRRLLSAFGIKMRGRPPKPEGPQTPAQRKDRQREFEKKFGWIKEQAFELLPYDDYLVMECPRDDGAPLFDLRSGFAIVTGLQLRTELEKHYKTYGDPPVPEGVTPRSVIGYRFHIKGWSFKRVSATNCPEAVEETPTLVLVYPDSVRYFIPDIRNDYTDADIMAGKGCWSLNQGIFLKKDAPQGMGLLISGWREGWGDEFGFEDRADQSQLDNYNAAQHEAGEPEYAELDRPKPSFVDTVDQIHQKEGDPVEDLFTTILQKAGSDVLQPTCKLCHAVLEYDPEQALAHLKAEHPRKYEQLQHDIARWRKSERNSVAQRERRMAEKQKHCREDHEGMLVRRLEAGESGLILCGKCGMELCRPRHFRMVKEELQRREPYARSNMKKRQKPFYCSICGKPIYVTQIEGLPTMN